MKRRSYELTKLDPYEYQKEALEKTRNRNGTVISLPTGTGKTLVGCMWSCELLNTGDINRVLVIEPSRYLVEQVTSYYSEHTNIPTENLYGVDSPERRRQKWNKGKAVVTTPQTALNDLRYLDFDAVIVDECHHTTGEHAFAELMKAYGFKKRLGLSATVPQNKEKEIEKLIGEVIKYSWEDPRVKKYVPDCGIEIFDSHFGEGYKKVKNKLDEFERRFEGNAYAGLPALGKRMLFRDGAMALSNTLENSAVMGDLMREELLPLLKETDPLHKLEKCNNVLNSVEFNKAILFVDRVSIAERIAEEFSHYNPVLLLGRLHSGREAQQEAVKKANMNQCRLIISTSAGEEGIDLPKADLLIVWSNVVSSVRFVQRLGRVMRKTEDRTPKTAAYIATPETVDYEALKRGFSAAVELGVDLGGIDQKFLKRKSISYQVQNVVESNPLQYEEILEALPQSNSKVERWLREQVREGDMFYLYWVPENLDDWRKAVAEMPSTIPEPEDYKGKRVYNNLQPQKENRYYFLKDEIPLIEDEFSHLIKNKLDHRFELSFGPNYKNRNEFQPYGNIEELTEKVLESLEIGDRFYGEISFEGYDPIYTVSMKYQCPVEESVLKIIFSNMEAIVSELDMRLN